MRRIRGEELPREMLGKRITMPSAVNNVVETFADADDSRSLALTYASCPSAFSFSFSFHYSMSPRAYYTRARAPARVGKRRYRRLPEKTAPFESESREINGSAMVQRPRK